MDFDKKKARAVIAARGDCAGPISQSPPYNGFSRDTVTIVCDNGYVPVVEWIALCERQFPAAIDRVEELENALEEAVRWISDRSSEGSILLKRLYNVLNRRT